MVSVSLFGTLVYLGHPVTVVYKLFMKIATSALIFSYGLSVLLYIKSFTVANHELAEGGNSGGYFQN